MLAVSFSDQFPVLIAGFQAWIDAIKSVGVLLLAVGLGAFAIRTLSR